VVKVARRHYRHLPNLLTYFLYLITNATTEGLNSGIDALKYAARGSRSFGNYPTPILFFCGSSISGRSCPATETPEEPSIYL
jgi:transposase